MKREIKFRAYDTEENKYFEPTYEAYKGKLDDLSVSFSGELNRRTLQMCAEHESMFKGRYILEQFTGLKDRHGVEIYEGDIVNVLNTISKRHKNNSMVIIFECGAFCLKLINDTTKTGESISTSIHRASFESINYTKKDIEIKIIGNIHTK